MSGKRFAGVLAVVFITALGLGVAIGTAMQDIPEGTQQVVAVGILAASAAAVSWMSYRTWIHKP